MKWLSELDLSQFPKLKYQGWAPNRPYSPNNPKYDPNNPLRPKHPDTHYFRYYTLKINNHEYWVNVKVHKLFGEVIYVVEKNKPTDIIKTRKKRPDTRCQVFSARYALTWIQSPLARETISHCKYTNFLNILPNFP